MRIVIIILLSTLASVVSRELPMPPTNEEMIRHFATHEAAFDKMRKIIAGSPEGSFHHLLLSPCDILILDPAGQTSYQPNQVQNTPVRGLSRSDRIQPDSLLPEVGCSLVLIDHRKQRTVDSIYVSLSMLYYSRDIVDAGTSKSLVYGLELRSRRGARVTEHGDLNKTYHGTCSDTILYKSVKRDWYVELDHSR